jgi:hypothetical protein
MEKKLLGLLCLSLITSITTGCKINTVNMNPNNSILIERTIPKYEEAGQKYGREFVAQKLQIKPGNLDNPLSQRFIADLCDRRSLGYFYVHSELKEAFKRGFRVGYEDRTADLVLGPQITAAAGKVGEATSSKIVNSIITFDQQWEQILRDGVEVFIVLISEGSQTDRKIFIDSFNTEYVKEYNAMAQKYNKGNRQGGILVTQGGTSYTLDADLNAIQMPAPSLIENRFYSQAFIVMGDEWGRRYGTNLVKREELIDMLRRCKPALEEGEGSEANLKYIYQSFADSYKADAEDTFKSIMKEAGIKDKLIDKILVKNYKK